MRAKQTLFWVFLAAGTLAVQAQIEQKSSVLDGSGRTSSGGSYTNISAAGQPGGISVSSAGDVVNYAGFLNTFSLRPGRDTDADGLEDELDTDNDNDSLTDQQEVNGSAFDPATSTDVNNPDSDNDGVRDGEEAVAGTDPGDADANFRIVDLQRSGDQLTVYWRARGGKTYVVDRHESVDGVLGSARATNTAAGGAAPWYVVTNTHTVTAGSAIEAVTVEVRE